MADWVKINEARWLNMEFVEGAYEGQDVLTLYYRPTTFFHWFFRHNGEHFQGEERRRLLRYLDTQKGTEDTP